MSKKLQELMERAQSWPEEAQEEFARLGDQIDDDLKGGDYHATREELRAIDQALAAVDRGEVATDEEIKAAFAKFRPA